MSSEKPPARYASAQELKAPGSLQASSGTLPAKGAKEQQIVMMVHDGIFRDPVQRTPSGAKRPVEPMGSLPQREQMTKPLHSSFSPASRSAIV
jgi:hypothetical protein